MSHQYLFIAAVCFLAAFSTLRAEEKAGQQPDRTPLFKQIDANGDGQISADEVPGDKRRLFERLVRRGDANSDGKLSLEELTKAMADEPRTAPPADGGDRSSRFLEADPQEVFKRLDTNGDGKVELSELPEQARERMQQFMDEYDSNRDKALTLDEFRKGQQMLRERFGALIERLRSLDKNGDGKWSVDELPPFLQRQFDKIDANGDKAIDADELKAGLQKLRRPNQ